MQSLANASESEMVAPKLSLYQQRQPAFGKHPLLRHTVNDIPTKAFL